MKFRVHLLLTVWVAVAVVPALAGARDDVRIDNTRDERRNTVHKLVNTGSQTVRAKIELRVECSGVSTNRKPVVRDYWVNPGDALELAKTRSDASCRRRYRLVDASYP